MNHPGATRLVSFLLLIGLSACGGEEIDRAPFTISGVGFATPESVLHDQVADVYLVSNISGDPFEHDGDGFISRLSPDGKVLALRWIDSKVPGVELDAPKGMALSGELLWVADLDQVRAFDRKSGEPVHSVAIPGATFLNDVCAGADGTVYVTDSGFGPGFAPTGTDAIWRVTLEGGAPTVVTVASGSEFKHPNGIGISPRGDLFCVDWGVGEFALITPRGSREAPLKLPAAQLDGLVRLGDGRWLASSWEGKCVYAITTKEEVTVFAGGLEQPADIGLDLVRHRLLVPLFGSDELRCLPLGQ